MDERAPGPDRPDEEPADRRGRWAFTLAVGLATLIVVAGLTLLELRTSALQSRYFSGLAAGASYALGPGPSDRVRFPDAGPMDQRLGYTRIPGAVEVLREHGFEVVEQARVSEGFLDLMDRGLFAIYREKAQGGLRIVDREGRPIHATPHPTLVYTDFDSIPPLLWRSLVFIENRDFLREDRPRNNPAVEWDRFGRSIGDLVLSKLGSDRNVPGGSTLATQLEKFRHAPEGRTSSGSAKLKQMASASVRAYLDGPETLEAQRRILLDYINSVPLAAQRGHGEVTGTADGLWAWYGVPFDRANRVLRGGEGLAPDEAAERPLMFRRALSLLIAHRRPSYYLAQQDGRAELEEATDQHIRLLRNEGAVDSTLAAAALEERLDLRAAAPELPRPGFVERKAANQLRAHLLQITGTPQLYELDRYDLRVEAGLDLEWQEGAAEVLRGMADRAFLDANGFAGLLASGDPANVIYTFTLLERTPLGNVVRVQTDNFDGPLNLSGAGRLELGSTAKLRTLVTYLEVIEELHRELAGLPRDSLRRMVPARQDRLTQWAIDHFMRNPDGDLESTLRAAMSRTYSASPAESFATGGGVQSFNNFDDTYDGAVLSVRDAFRYSVNLPSIRTMRDVVQYEIARNPTSSARIFEDPDDPARRAYLAGFADREGSEFVRRFYRKYQPYPAPERLARLVEGRRMTPQRIAWAFRTVAPNAPVERYVEYVGRHAPHSAASPEVLRGIFERADPRPHLLADLGYLAGVHPLELWVLRQLLQDPDATLQEVLDASAEARQDVYTWLFNARRRGAQDTRIRTMLELEAFQRILARWKRVGYPFDNIVPSYGTAIGSSGDRPLALAELLGIIRNDGIRYPVARIEELRFAEDTPFETALRKIPPEGERVLSVEVARTLQETLIDVVENGTARRARGSVVDAEGRPLAMGGKTGTGDNRFRVYGAGGALLETRVVNRTATLAFFLGDRFYGVVTAYVPVEAAGGYRFTSALPSQVVRTVGPRLTGLADPPVPAPDSTAVAGGGG